jgi:hypothetical protein
LVIWQEEVRTCRIKKAKALCLARSRRCKMPFIQKWKYDFIIQFLSGPVWKTSILDFVDYHCVVFDTE